MQVPSLVKSMARVFCTVGVAQLPDHVALPLAFTVSTEPKGSSRLQVPPADVQLRGGEPLVTVPLPTTTKFTATWPLNAAVQLAA